MTTRKPQWWGIGGKIAPPRFLVFLAVFVAGLPIGVTHHGWGHGTMLAFDLATIIFLAMLASIFRGGEAAKMRRVARENDANRALLLGFSALVTLVILVAVANELGGGKGKAAVALIIATLVLAWLFSNVVYALHYAHLFYLDGEDGKDAGGLDFPDTKEPDYWDFLYFSATLGMTFQTSDVSIETGTMRRVVLGQSMAAFVFNLGVLAFTINVLGGGN